MSNLTDKELRELDAWICVNVIGYDPKSHWFCSYCAEPRLPQQVTHAERCHVCDNPVKWNECEPYTTDPAAAMEVLKECVECRKITGQFNVVIYRPALHGNWAVGIETAYSDQHLDPELAETLELAICLFAKKLFSK